jgi:thiamine-phosphate diphosphorylase
MLHRAVQTTRAAARGRCCSHGPLPLRRVAKASLALRRQSSAALAAAGHRGLASAAAASPAPSISPYAVYLVTDDIYDDGSLVDRVAAAIEGGTTCVQLRLKDCDTRRLIELGRELQPLCKAAGVPFLVDDRVDVALALDADGVHVGQSDLPPAMVRQLIGPDKILGVTLDLAHPESVAEAVLPPVNADYLGSNAVFPTPTKDTAAYGMQGLTEATELIAAAAATVGRPAIPLVAIGGVSVANGAECLAAGAEGLAVVSAILGAESPAAASGELRDLF